jgi:hypothetical protein
MADDITTFFVHQVTAKTRLGTGANGDVYSAPTTVWGYLDGKSQLVRGQDGEQAVSTSQFYCAVADAGKFSLDTVVTLPNGTTTAQVITVNPLDVAGLLEGVEHTVVYLK